MTFRIPVIRYLIAALFSLVAAVSSTKAADELLVYVFSEGKPVAGADVLFDELFAGQTAADGSLLADIEGDGGHILAIKTDTTQAGTRFTANAGQLVDVIAQLDTGEVHVDVYSQTESIADQRSAPQGSLAIRVTQEGQPVAQEPVYIAGYSGSLQTDSSGDASVTLKRGRYRVQVAEKTAYFRVVGGLDRSVVVAISESAETMEIAAPTMEEVFVTATFDPSGREVSERDTANIVDTIGVELLARFSDSDVAASVVRVPGISVQDDKYVFIRGLGGRYVSSTLNNATMPSTIEAGVKVFGKTGTFANLFITRGSKLMAMGTKSAPIVFSSDDDGLDGSGEWGGLIMHGYAPHNECAVGGSYCDIDSEGESGFAGGYDPDDSSGVLRYVVVAEGGYEFSTGNEINGISLVSVGRGTEMDYIQVHGNP